MSETANTTEIPLIVDDAHRRHILGSEPIVFHCHHYNTFLQRSILDASYVDSRPFLVGAAAEVAFAQLSNLFGAAGVDERLALAEQLYSWAGFGRVELSSLTEGGGTVTAPSSHYGASWRTKFGPAERPVDLFTAGWLAGAAAAVFDRPAGSYTAQQTACIGSGAAEGQFEVTPTPADHPVLAPAGVGPVTDHRSTVDTPPTVDYEGIYGAVTGLPLAGDAQGLIAAFGVYLTHHYANYYNRISFEFERAMADLFGPDGITAARPLLVEAGHVCAFNTFGGIMKSAEWDALIKPNLTSPEDWVHGIVAVVNALGWGRWEVDGVTDSGARFVLHDDYESVGYLGMYGPADHAVSYLAEGAVSGVMNLVYRGRIAERPDLTPDFYEHLFKTRASYTATCVQSQAMGADSTVLEVKAPR